VPLSFPSQSECRPADIRRIEAECGTDVLIEQCELICTPDASSTACFLELEQSIDACSVGFEFEGVQYSNMLEYCTAEYQTDRWNLCEQIDGYWVVGGSTSYGGSQSAQAIIAGSQTDDLVDNFRRVADDAFAAGSYFVEVIGFDERFSCLPREGQSIATTLATVASTPDDVFPICESYAPALARIERFAGSLLDTQHGFALSRTEQIEAVRVTDSAGQERELGAGDFRYDPDTQTLVLQPEAIASSDVSLSVEVARDCVPDAR
jgi:hypothetical protein